MNPQLDPDIQSLPARQTELGSLRILRALPRRQRRMVGAWCFLDRYGPLRFADAKPMDVAPHPHIGIQTASWLLEGEMIHHDSLGGEALMRAGQLNLMTAGRGIAHSEETPATNSGMLSGVQLWIALPDFVFDGDAFINKRRLERGALHYLGVNRDEIHIAGSGGSRLLLIGGEPFTEPIVMWWNFVGRTQEEIAQAREDWMHHQRFGEVRRYNGPRVPAPEFSVVSDSGRW